MPLLLRKASLWAALLGFAFIAFMVRKTTAIESIPPPTLPAPPKPFERAIAAAGIIEALGDNTKLGIPMSGLVQEVHVKPWDTVEAGTPLIRLDDRELQAQLATQRAEVAVREAELARARRQHARTDALRATQAVSQDEADTRHDDHAVALARLDAAHAAVKHTQAMIERLTVRAPAQGTILQVNVRVGEHATPAAGSPIILMGSINSVQVRADVDEQIAPRIREGAPAVGHLKGDSRNSIPLDFVRIEPLVAPKRNLTGSGSERVDTRVLQVVYRFTNDPARRVYVGQQIDVFIQED